ncbi:MAG: tyrosine-type recombinase/integrase [Candidatus Villigracilaceae bacterium]
MPSPESGKTLAEAAQDYLRTVQQARSENTARAYANGMAVFLRVLKEHWIEPEAPAAQLTEDGLTWMLAYLKVFSSATERLYTQAVKGFYEYLSAERLAEINLPRLAQLIRQRARRSGQRLPQFPRDEIEQVLNFVNNFTNSLSDSLSTERLRALRDRAFLLTLADTGLRVHEACALRRGDIDWNEGRAVIIGKGDKQAVVRFSGRALSALQDYLLARSRFDGASSRPLSSLPLFARHDKGAGKKVKPITTATGRNIVSERVRQALGEEAEGRITPHSFRHYFVTTVLRASGNLKLAQELARHASVQVTQRYAHLSDDELDRGYHEIFA